MLKHKRSSIKISKNSIVLDILPVLKARNIQFPFAYLEKIGMSTATASKMLKGKAVQINFYQLTELCQNLNCTPNDILALRDMTLPENHQLQALRKFEPAVKEATIEDWMMGKSVEEVREILKNKE